MRPILLCFVIIISSLGIINSQCVESDCISTYSTYGPMGCDRDCILRYTGEYGNIRIPIKVFFLGTNLNTLLINITNMINEVNCFFQTQSFPVSLYIYSGYVDNNSVYNNFCLDLINDDCPCEVPLATDLVQEAILDNPYGINLFITDTLRFKEFANQICNDPVTTTWGNSAYPQTQVFGQNAIILCDSITRGEIWAIMAHELSHNLGLFHTWENLTFDTCNTQGCSIENCNDNICLRNDGIVTTPACINGVCENNGTGTQSINIMDSNHEFFQNPDCGSLELVQCQVAKMLDVLFECRPNICITPEPPSCLVDGEVENELTYFRDEELDLVVAVLDEQSATNTGNFARFTVRGANGNIAYQTYTHIFDLDYLIEQNILPDYGEFTVEVRDSSIYSPQCIGDPFIITVIIHPCNNDDICDPGETVNNCSDCEPPGSSGNSTLTFMEYFIDTDPGFGNGTPLTLINVTNSLSNYSIPLSALDPGVHVFYLRALDSQNQWSFTHRKLFYIRTDVTTENRILTDLEYFIDVDPGVGSGNQLNLLDDINSIETYDIALDTFRPGVHVLYVRGKDSADQWSFTQRKLFYIRPDVTLENRILTDLEYFIDLDPGVGNGLQLELLDDINSIGTYDISIDTFNSGVHVLYVRGKDSADQWSFTQRKLFYIRPDVRPENRILADLEYFIDTDPGFGNGIQVTLNNDTNSTVVFDLNLNSISPGMHTFYVRAMDTANIWSFTFAKPFTIFVIGPVVYVDWDATGQNVGTSWTNAFINLQSALSLASTYDTIQEIWIAQGQYKPTSLLDRDKSFIFSDSIKLYGGFLGNELNRNQRTSNSSLVVLTGDIGIQGDSSDNSYHVVIGDLSCVDCLLDRMTIKHGNANSENNNSNFGGGMLNYGIVDLSEVIFVQSYSTSYGSAIYNSGSMADLRVIDCQFNFNESQQGTDIYNFNGSKLKFIGENIIDE